MTTVPEEAVFAAAKAITGPLRDPTEWELSQFKLALTAALPHLPGVRSAARKELMKQIREGTAHGFLNDGSQPEGNPDLDCPYCCGSGHKGDIHSSSARELTLEERLQAIEQQLVVNLGYFHDEKRILLETLQSHIISHISDIRALGTSREQLNKTVSNVPDQQENEPGAHGERERALEEAATLLEREADELDGLVDSVSHHLRSKAKTIRSLKMHGGQDE